MIEPIILKRHKTKRFRAIAVLTSGGDAPGMNAAVRAVTRFGISQGVDVYGVIKGYSGLVEGQIQKLSQSSVANIIQRGGTILKTDRCPEWFKKSMRRKGAEFLRAQGIDGLVTIGGDGTYAGAHIFERENGFPCIGLPGTIDNDIAETEETIGFDTAVNTAIEAIDRIRDTASSHDRIFLVEVMGHSSGFIALLTGIGGGAETIVVPEAREPIDSVVRTIRRGMERGKTSSIIVVAEGPKPGLAQQMAERLSRHGFRNKVCILGHTQRGGPPTAHDRLLASVLGVSAVSCLLGGKSDCMVGVRDGKTALVPFLRVVGRHKTLPPRLLKLAQVLAT